MFIKIWILFFLSGKLCQLVKKTKPIIWPWLSCLSTGIFFGIIMKTDETDSFCSYFPFSRFRAKGAHNVQTKYITLNNLRKIKFTNQMEKFIWIDISLKWLTCAWMGNIKVLWHCWIQRSVSLGLAYLSHRSTNQRRRYVWLSQSEHRSMGHNNVLDHIWSDE